MRRILFGVFVTLALLVAAAPGLLAQETTGAIEGVVVTPAARCCRG
jgi:hypothetical protein